MRTIDYLTIRLSEEFDFREFLQYASKEEIDPATGQSLGAMIPTSSFTMTATGGNHAVSLYKGSERHGVELAKEYGLQVTRIDIAIDLDVPNPTELYEQCLQSVKAWLKSKEKSGIHTPVLNEFTGTPNRRNGANGFRLGAPSSENQLRVYSKASPVGSVPGLRLEYQLRGDNAQAVWNAIRSEPDNQALLQYQFDACLNRYHPGCLPIKVNEYAILSLPEKASKKSDTEAWFKGTVAQSVVRFFDETGQDMSVFLAEHLKETLVERVKKQSEHKPADTRYDKQLALLKKKVLKKYGTFEIK